MTFWTITLLTYCFVNRFQMETFIPFHRFIGKADWLHHQRHVANRCSLILLVFLLLESSHQRIMTSTAQVQVLLQQHIISRIAILCSEKKNELLFHALSGHLDIHRPWWKIRGRGEQKPNLILAARRIAKKCFEV